MTVDNPQRVAALTGSFADVWCLAGGGDRLVAAAGKTMTGMAPGVTAQVEEATARQTGKAPSILCMRSTGASCKVKGSEDFLLGEMLADLGCVNVADGDSALLENLSLEAILADDPDYIFMVLQGSDPAAMATPSLTDGSPPS